MGRGTKKRFRARFSGRHILARASARARQGKLNITPTKKQVERRIIEYARERSSLLPAGELREFERPDWIIPTACIGIEVSLLLPTPPDDYAFSGPQVSSFQADVVRAAQQIYDSRGYRPVDVLVFFRNEWRKRLNKARLSETLAEFVAKNLPADNATVTVEPYESDLEDFSVVRIFAHSGSWQAGAAATRMQITHEELAARIAGKNRLLAEYRKRLPGFEIWLLFATAFPVLWDVYIPPKVLGEVFEFGFDRVLLSDWESGVSQLKRLKA